MISLPNSHCSTRTRGRYYALLAALIVGLTLSASTSAFAQDEDVSEQSEQADEDAAAADQEAVEEGDDPAAGAEEASEEPPRIEAKSNPELEKKLDTYWAVEAELPSVEGRLYTREGRVAAGLFAGILSSEAFYWYIPVGLRATYYVSDTFGVELEGSFTGAPDALSHNTELSDFLEAERPADFTAAMRGDRFLWRASALAVWHPLYGKFSLLQRKLSHFDLSLAAGAGAVGVDRPDELRKDTSSEIAPEAVFGAGAQFFITQNLVVRADGRLYVYPGPQTADEKGFFERLSAPVEFLAGVSYLF